MMMSITHKCVTEEVFLHPFLLAVWQIVIGGRSRLLLCHAMARREHYHFINTCLNDLLRAMAEPEMSAVTVKQVRVTEFHPQVAY